MVHRLACSDMRALAYSRVVRPTGKAQEAKDYPRPGVLWSLQPRVQWCWFRPTLARLSLRQEVVRLRLHTHHFLRTRTHACARACMTHTRPPASSPPAPVHESGAPGLKSWCLRSRRPGGGSCGATWAPTLGARSTSVPRALRPQAVGPPLRRRSPTWCRHRSSPPCAP